MTEPDFWKKYLIWRCLWKGLQISPKSDTLIFFSKTALTAILVFGLKLVLNMTFNFNETYFSEKFIICRYLTTKLSKNCPNWGFRSFSRLCIISFPWFCTWWWVGIISSCFLAIRHSSQCILVFYRIKYRGQSCQVLT